MRLFVLLSLLGIAGCLCSMAEIPESFGVNMHFLVPAVGEVEMLAQTGWRYVRRDMAWGVIETKRAVYNFTSYDILVKALLANNIKALFILDYTNNLYDNGLAPYTDEGRQAFAKWATASVQRYQGLGFVWELWNEPNLGNWKPKPSAANYSALALVVGQQLKASVPNEFFVGPACALFDYPYLEAVFELGVLKYFDAVSLHPYRQSIPETATADYVQLRQLIQKYYPAGKPIISSEWGYSLNFGVIHGDLHLQAAFVTRLLLNNFANGIMLSIVYDWHDDCTDPSNAECNFGTVYNAYHTGRTPPYDVKPAYVALQTMMSVLESCSFSELIYPSDTDYVMKFSKGAANTAVFAAWTASTNHSVQLTAIDRCLSQIDCYGRRVGSLCPTSGTISVAVTVCPTYLL